MSEGTLYISEEMIEELYIKKDKIREYCKRELAFKNRLEREKQEISEYNKGRFDTYQNILEELLGDDKDE